MSVDVSGERVNDVFRRKKSKPKKRKKKNTRKQDERNGQARQRRRVRKYHKKRYRKERSMALGWRGLEMKPTDWPKIVELTHSNGQISVVIDILDKETAATSSR